MTQELVAAKAREPECLESIWHRVRISVFFCIAHLGSVEALVKLVEMEVLFPLLTSGSDTRNKNQMPLWGGERLDSRELHFATTVLVTESGGWPILVGRVLKNHAAG